MLRIQLMAENIVPLVNNKNKFIICSNEHFRKTVKFLFLQLGIGFQNVASDRIFEELHIIFICIAIIRNTVHTKMNDIVLVQMCCIGSSFGDFQSIK